jgi:hypothetical protein
MQLSQGSQHNPAGNCPFCSYRTGIGRCPECGQLVTCELLVHDSLIDRVLRWERLSLCSKLGSVVFVLPNFLTLLCQRERVPVVRIQSRHPNVVLLVATLISVTASVFCDVREAWEPLWILRQAGRRPNFVVTVFSIIASVVAFCLFASHPFRKQLYWRGLVYGLSAFTTLQLAWVLWCSLGVFTMPAALSPLSYHNTTLDPTIWQRGIFYVTLMFPLVSSLLFILVLPLYVSRQPRRNGMPKQD